MLLFIYAVQTKNEVIAGIISATSDNDAIRKLQRSIPDQLSIKVEQVRDDIIMQIMQIGMTNLINAKLKEVGNG
jgi:hypothetical protein